MTKSPHSKTMASFRPIHPITPGKHCPMEKMTDEERREFLRAGTRTAKLATVRADGRPHVAPVWFVLDGDDLVFTTMATAVKSRNLRRSPRVMLSVDEEAPPFAFVLIEGVATGV